MKFTKPALLLIALAIAVLMTGCSQDEGPSGKEVPFVGGTTGVAVDFAEGSPPGEVYDGGTYPFSISVKLENKGEYTVPKDDVQIKISGIMAEEFDTSEEELKKNPEQDLQATEKDSEGDIIEGSPVFVEFPDLNHVDTLEGNQNYPIRAEVCYKYQTHVKSTLCILDDNLDITEDAVCDNKGKRAVHNSGAPVHVRSLQENPQAEDKVRFRFTVSHEGTGDIYKKDTTCSTEKETDENKVWVEVKTPNVDGPLSCSGLTGGTETTGYARLYGGDKKIMCTQEVSTSSDYEARVKVNLTYDYQQQKSADLLVKHSAN